MQSNVNGRVSACFKTFAFRFQILLWTICLESDIEVTGLEKWSYCEAPLKSAWNLYLVSETKPCRRNYLWAVNGWVRARSHKGPSVLVLALLKLLTRQGNQLSPRNCNYPTRKPLVAGWRATDGNTSGPLVATTGGLLAACQWQHCLGEHTCVLTADYQR